MKKLDVLIPTAWKKIQLMMEKKCIQEKSLKSTCTTQGDIPQEYMIYFNKKIYGLTLPSPIVPELFSLASPPHLILSRPACAQLAIDIWLL